MLLVSPLAIHLEPDRAVSRRVPVGGLAGVSGDHGQHHHGNRYRCRHAPSPTSSLTLAMATSIIINISSKNLVITTSSCDCQLRDPHAQALSPALLSSLPYGFLDRHHPHSHHYYRHRRHQRLNHHRHQCSRRCCRCRHWHHVRHWDYTIDRRCLMVNSASYA